MLIGPQGPPWWIFFQKFFKNVLVYPQLTQKYVLWHSKLEKSILGSRELKVIFHLWWKVERGKEKCNKIVEKSDTDELPMLVDDAK